MYTRFDETSFPFNAEVKMYRSGRIIILYDQLDSTLTLNSCTIGIQSSDISLGLPVCYNTDYLHNGLAIMFFLPSDFIISVNPAHGFVPQDSSRVVTITYDAHGFDPGEYSEFLMLKSNDPDLPDYNIYNTMHVTLPAEFAGTVTDNDDGNPLPGVSVTAGQFRTETGEDGVYTLLVNEGTYDLHFDKPGYETTIVADTFAAEGEVTPVDAGMWDANNPPAFVHAEPMDGDTWCSVTWASPAGPYEHAC